MQQRKKSDYGLVKASQLKAHLLVFLILIELDINISLSCYSGSAKTNSTSKPKPMIILTEIIVRKSAHALVVAERRVPYLLSTESNMPSFTVTIRIPKVTSTVIKKLPPNILGKHQLVVSYAFIEYELDRHYFFERLFLLREDLLSFPFRELPHLIQNFDLGLLI